ncbi:hybrid sensor histidine kinase/response regulator transcription factor [Bacteroides sp.]|uniref:hybrid sensor histidine kinase/response regulator transcription factor n=1 Tax=Bacteroides sp. TaxID=29523 RepID=UPI002637D88D|nr:hybrid sensor histidine kinase/response regulator transcription factor [Bacteroides sp.]MDD3036407.1 two-component regulator propeller domain-containing protein [Bacteroides sp.]
MKANNYSIKKSFSLNGILLLIIALLFVVSEADASYTLRQFSSKNGLSNSAILSMCQDRHGVIWIGSCDGLNVYDGSYLGLYKSANLNNRLSGNLIDRVMEGEEDVLWVQTNYGLDRFDTRRQTIQSFKQFKDINFMDKSPDGDYFIVKDDGYIYYYYPGANDFQKLNVEKIDFEKVQLLKIDSSGILWVISSGYDNRSYMIEKNGDQVSLIPCNYFNHPESILWAFVEEEMLYFVDSTYSLYECELRNRQIYYVADLEEEIHHRGEVSSIIKQKNDFFIGFKNSGLIRLEYLSNSKVKYAVHPINIQSGIFCLMKDRFQDVIWVGTDGQGIYMCFTDEFSIHNVLLDTPEYKVNNPVRSLFIDQEKALWVGTKGDGILRIMDFYKDGKAVSQVERFSTANSTLTHNSVYSFASSRWNRLWIGTEGGLNYYSYPEKALKEFSVLADDKTVKYVHSIVESNDSTLWVATVGEGIVRIIMDTSGYSPKVKSAKRFVLDGGKRASNYFFVSFQENDSTIWFGNRGYGAYKMDTNTCELTPCRIDGVVKNQMVNDIFAIYKNNEGYWFGTSFGLARLYQDEYRVYNEMDGFPNNTVHSILEGKDNHLWLSTNQGMVRFNVRDNTVQTYRQQSGLEVTEFSDGAFFKDQHTGTLFFGGTNGFITISENEHNSEEYIPALHFNRLSIFGKEYNIYDFLKGDKKEKLVLDYSQNFFNLSFLAIDHINGNNYTYFYKIDELSDSWIENGLSTTAAFSNLSPGEYTLLVKYRSNITGKESEPYSLIIRITPPWYMTIYAYIVYFLLFAAFAVGCIWLLLNRYRMKRNAMIEQMNQQQREELYESKLRFFTNITHEFCTPLTLISGPCEKILTYNKIDEYIHKYASMIQQNALKLNALILELIEFRRLETGNKLLNIKHISVTEQVRTIAESFGELVESRGIDYRLQLEENVNWNTDTSCLSKIVSNLISNAFKYTPENGSIVVELFVEGGQLYFRISNTGKGIKKADLTKIFDRYKILDNFEVQNKNGISPRNGLGLAICHSMVNLLNGQIHVSSKPDEITTFEVLLPMMEVSADVEDEKFTEEPILSREEQIIKLQNTSSEFDKNKQTIMIIDDDPSMLWFVTEIFVGKYNVIPLYNAEDALKQLTLQLPDLIISDVMMPGMDGMSFAKRIKSDKLLSRIPLILLSALNNIDEQTRGIESGAEAYITKPFNVEYLEKVVKRLMQREEDLKEYYSSVLSAFELDDGHFMHKEDKSFFEKMMQIIDSHIQDSDLSVDLLSNSLGFSTRQFYRRLKNVTDKTPADIIREYRLSIVERLLLTTQLSIEEIMDKTGFNNRGTFYKAFAQKFEMTPKQFRNQKKKDAQSTQEDESSSD